MFIFDVFQEFFYFIFNCSWFVQFICVLTAFAVVLISLKIIKGVMFDV